jgi:hypothetical protein
MMRWLNRWHFKRAFAVISLCVLTYMGITRCIALIRADHCLDAGGSYDPNLGTCRPHASRSAG